MTGVVDGFAIIGLVVAVGILLAHVGVIDAAGQRTLSTLAFFVASPALLLRLLEKSQVSDVFSGALLASAGGVLVIGVISLLLSWAWRRPVAEAVIGVLTSVYCNAANLGLPVAAYVLGDAGLVAPVMLMQLVVIQPLALTVLDSTVRSARLTLAKVVCRPFQNPITIGSLIGLLLAITHAGLPEWLGGAVSLVGDMSVPSMLLAYGASLRLGPVPGRGAGAFELAGHVALKMVAQPLVTYLLGRYVFGVGRHTLLAVTVIAALPTAQNVFVIADRYGRGSLLARDVILLTTLVSLPVALAISALLA